MNKREQHFDFVRFRSRYFFLEGRRRLEGILICYSASVLYVGLSVVNLFVHIASNLISSPTEDYVSNHA